MNLLEKTTIIEEFSSVYWISKHLLTKELWAAVESVLLVVIWGGFRIASELVVPPFQQDTFNRFSSCSETVLTSEPINLIINPLKSDILHRSLYAPVKNSDSNSFLYHI